jgi:hypothetical protein
MSASQFVKDPDAFMRQNIILPDAVLRQYDNILKDAEFKQEANPDKSGVRRFTLDLVASVPVTSLGGGGGAVYRLKDAKPTAADHLIAYWCPYHDNRQLGVMLEGDAPYMFTAVMDGCSFGIGSANPDGSRAVFHANMKKAAGTMKPEKQKSVEKAIGRQVAEQNKLLSHMFVPDGNIIGPEFYGGGIDLPGGGWSTTYAVKFRSTTVGLRVKGQWTFYTLRFRPLNKGKAYEHHGLHLFVPQV